MSGTSFHNALDRVKDRIQRGLITAAQGNVELVRYEGVRLIPNRLPRDVRAALMAGVKAGELGHLKKEGHKPEAFFHPNSRQRAVAERNAVERRIKGASRTVMAHTGDVVAFEEAQP